MKIFGKEAPANFKPLTVRDLKAFIARFEASNGVGSLDSHWIHMLDGEDPDSVEGRYATCVKNDIFDTDTGTDDATVSYPCLALSHEE